jgi:AcrR family transcriptional regulator
MALRERILGAALRAFAERGFHGTSVPEIARAAGVGVGSIYRHFESKEHLVNAVFREAKGRLRDALLLDFDLGQPPAALFAGVWARLVRFQRANPQAFQFLEMQDHVPYLDGESRALEASLLAPILLVTQGAGGDEAGSAALVIAMVWGAFVSLTKAERLGYLTLDDEALRRAGDICFAAVAHALRLPEASGPPARRSHAPSQSHRPHHPEGE